MEIYAKVALSRIIPSEKRICGCLGRPDVGLAVPWLNLLHQTQTLLSENFSQLKSEFWGCGHWSSFRKWLTTFVNKAKTFRREYPVMTSRGVDN